VPHLNINKVCKVAIIGTGAIATKAHIPCFLRNQYTKIEAVVDIDSQKAEKVAKKFNIKYSLSSINELLDALEIDAISVCTPPDTHADITVKALKNGIHVLCEKPLAESVKSGLRMVEAAESSDKILMIDFNRRFHPNYRKAESMAKKGFMGHVYQVEYDSMQTSPLFEWSKSPWFYYPSLGGSLLDQGPHVFDMLNWFLGKPCLAYSHVGVHLNSPVDEFCVAIVEYEDCKVGVGMMSWLSSKSMEQLTISGTGRTLYASPSFLLDVNPTDLLETSLWKAATSTLLSRIKDILNGKSLNTYQLGIDHFIDCVRTGRKPFIDGRVGLVALTVTEAAIKSIEKKKAVRVPHV